MKKCVLCGEVVGLRDIPPPDFFYPDRPLVHVKCEVDAILKSLPDGKDVSQAAVDFIKGEKGLHNLYRSMSVGSQRIGES